MDRQKAHELALELLRQIDSLPVGLTFVDDSIEWKSEKRRLQKEWAEFDGATLLHESCERFLGCIGGRPQLGTRDFHSWPGMFWETARWVLYCVENQGSIVVDVEAHSAAIAAETTRSLAEKPKVSRVNPEIEITRQMAAKEKGKRDGAMKKWFQRKSGELRPKRKIGNLEVFNRHEFENTWKRSS